MIEFQDAFSGSRKWKGKKILLMTQWSCGRREEEEWITTKIQIFHAKAKAKDATGSNEYLIIIFGFFRWLTDWKSAGFLHATHHQCIPFSFSRFIHSVSSNSSFQSDFEKKLFLLSTSWEWVPEVRVKGGDYVPQTLRWNVYWTFEKLWSVYPFPLFSSRRAVLDVSARNLFLTWLFCMRGTRKTKALPTDDSSFWEDENEGSNRREASVNNSNYSRRWSRSRIASLFVICLHMDVRSQEANENNVRTWDRGACSQKANDWLTLHHSKSWSSSLHTVSPSPLHSCRCLWLS